MNTKQINVVLLEDEAAHAEAIRRSLESAAGLFKVQITRSVKKYRELVAKNQPDIALLDMVLPDGNALDLLPSVQEPVVFPMLVLTSHGNEQAAVAALKKGALDYIVKTPETFANMPRIVTSALNQWASIQERKKAEQALQVSEANFHNSIENSPLGIRIVSEDGETLYTNRAFLDIYGYKNIEEFRITPVNERYAPESYLEFHERREKRQRRERLSDNYDLTIVRKDGIVRHLHVVRKEILWAGKKQFQTIYQDITEQKRVEEALRESEEKYRLIVEKSNDILFTFNATRVLLYVSPSVKTLLGYNQTDLIGHNFGSIVHPDDMPDLQRAIQRNIKDGYQTPGGNRYRIRHASGKWRWHDASGNAVHDENGKFLYFIGIARDITARVQAEEALKASEEKYATLVEQSTDGILILVDRRVVFANQKIKEMTGLSDHEIMGKAFYELTAPEYKEMLDEIYRKRQAGVELSINHELEMLNIDGKIIAVETKLQPIDYKGMKAGMVVVHDISERKQAEEIIQQSERNFRNSIDSSPLGVRITDSEWHTLYANKVYLNIFGYETAEELDAVPPEILFTPTEYRRYLRRSEKWLQGMPEPDKLEMEIIRKDGFVRRVQVSRTEVLWGGKTRYQIIYSDITERAQAESALKESENRYHQLVDTITSGVFIYKPIEDGEDFIIVDVNNAAEKMEGINRKDIIGKRITEVLPRVKEFDMFEAFQKVRRTGESEYFPANLHYGENAHGRWRDNWAYKLPSGEIVNVYNDITDRKLTEQALQESEEKYRMIVENTRDMIFTINDKEVFNYVSPSVKDMLGYNEAELIGKTFISLVHPEDVPIIQEETKRSLQPGYKMSSDNEYRMRHASGEWHWVVSRGTRVVDKNGKFLHFIGIARDITEHKQAEAEKLRIEEKAQISSRLAAIGEMAAGIAHEINNPLTSVLGFSQIVLEKENVPEDVKENLKLISEGSQRVAEIVRRLLMFARQAKPFKTSVNINEILENTLKLREYVLKTNNIEVITMFDRELPWISVDPSQMQQVFLNLIVNAEQAMKKAHGRGILTITTEKKLNSIRLSVQDDGPGISKENMRHLFEPFFTTKDPGEGTGLGLSLSRSIILEHNGEMSVESEIGNGATFVIELPIIEASPLEIETTSPPTQVQLFTKRNGRILVIDDEPTIRELLEKALTRVGHSVDVIADANTAMEIIDAGTIYDVIITDVRMPGMNGLELYALVTRKMPAMKRRIIFITGDVMGADIKAFIGNNSIPYLAKPFQMNELAIKIDNILDTESK